MSLLSRTFKPAVQAARVQARRYATEPPKTGSSAGLYATIGLVGAGGAGYYFYSQGGDLPTPKSSEERKVVPGQTTANAQATFTGGDQGFVSLMLKEVETLNHNSKRFRFHLPEDDQVSGLPITSAVITKYKGPEQQKPTIRPYTPVSDENTAGYIDFVIKRYEGGPMSSHIHDMQPGQRLDFKGPIPKYPWTPNKHNHIVMIAGGTGITPMYQLMRKIFSDPDVDKTKVTLLYGNVSEDDILLKKELEHLENMYPQRFRAFYVLDNPPASWKQGKGFVTKELIKTVAPEPKEENIKIFVCGPPAMYKAISGGKKSPSDQGELEGALADLGYTKDQVFKF